MNKIKILIFVVLFCLSNVLAQNETPPAPGKPRAVIIPRAFEKTLPNGLRVIVIERQNVPLVSANLIIENDYDRLEAAALMSALVMKGTTTRTAEKIAEQIEFLGGSLADYAAEDASGWRLRVMSDKFDEAMLIAADVVKNPIFPLKEIELIKRQGRDEREVQLKEPGFLAQVAVRRLIFGAEKYGNFPSLADLERVKRADLIKAHQNIYRANKAILVIVGDIAPAKAFALASKHFGNWRKTSPRQRPLYLRRIDETDKLNIEKITVIDLPESGQAAVAVGQSVFWGRQSTKYFAGLVANSILGGGYSARLNQEIRIKRGLSYGANSSLNIFIGGGILSAATQTKNESAAEVAEIIVNEFNRLASEKVADDELTPRKAVLIGDFSRDLETTDGLVERIGELAFNGLELKEINSFINKIQTVNDAEIQKYLRETYGGSDAHIVIAGDAQKFLPDLTKRFSRIEFDVIPATELDLSSENLRKSLNIK